MTGEIAVVEMIDIDVRSVESVKIGNEIALNGRLSEIAEEERNDVRSDPKNQRHHHQNPKAVLLLRDTMAVKRKKQKNNESLAEVARAEVKETKKNNSNSKILAVALQLQIQKTYSSSVRFLLTGILN